ncbi:MAG TPA: decaprenyl-phosphate phosphoribosyltransferase [Candidatus Eisenbacteria bacterium]|nr:decaprenyl-phosphate phosphoribosyltransferase [Candidatus Eisenbacteria bacterium]
MIGGIVRSMRAYQWTKNLVLFAGPIFSLRILDPAIALASVAGFLAFSLAVSAVYIFNDILDVERDRLHPEKKNRPIASGALPTPVAFVAVAALLAAGLGGAALLGPRFAMTAAAYVLLTGAYSLVFKRVALLDVTAIAAGFVLRAVAGVELVRDRTHLGPEGIAISPWLLVCAFFLALFLAIGKRLHELETLERDAARHRAALGAYTRPLLDQMVALVTGATVIAYSVYTISPETVAKYHGRPLYLTIPFVVYGIFRYLYLLYAEHKGGNPSEHLLRDRATLTNVVLWCCAVVAILLWPVS